MGCAWCVFECNQGVYMRVLVDHSAHMAVQRIQERCKDEICVRDRLTSTRASGVHVDESRRANHVITCLRQTLVVRITPLVRPVTHVRHALHAKNL